MSDVQKNPVRRCLLVDDSDEYLNILATMLEPDFEVVWAHNGLLAWNLFLEQTFDLIISDFVMPVMNGFELIRRIRDRDQKIPVFMITGYEIVDPDNFKRRMELLNINGLLSKPLKKDDLLSQLNELFV
ncbi:MAG: response regulator [Deltaproteobacteria bacterium]|nr:response regulator [Deltaproteobacteria bacterium]